MRTQLILQDIILNYVRREKVTVEIGLISGKTIEGIIHGFDKDTIILNSQGKQIMLYKSNIISVTSNVEVLTDK